MSTDLPTDKKSLTYRDAGVNIDAGNELVRRISRYSKATHRPELLGGLGGFAALAEIPTGYRRPVLVTGTDGVGTKLKLAIDYNRHDTVGQDLVAMCANDVLVTGGEPFLFLDYYATGRLDVDTAERVIKGIADGCLLAGCALVGGETAEMPGFYQEGDYDLAGFCVGVVERDGIVDGSRISEHDVLIGLPSSGPHSNGYSLIRRVLENQGMTPQNDLLDTLMAPTRIYAKAVLKLNSVVDIHGMVHVTGGGFIENIPRMFADETLAALIDLDSWKRPEVFGWLQQAGNIDETEMLRTFNCGIGYIICLPEKQADEAMKVLSAEGETPIRIGHMVRSNHKAASGQILIGHF